MREVQEMIIDANRAAAMANPYDVAIIGGGCSGVLLCVHLLCQSQQHLSIALIDRSPQRSIAGE
jgi:glycine/D-amino acid oxidase-like deaminating enzyme